jgi:Na+/proline symporter
MSSKDARTAVRSAILAGCLYLTVALLPLIIALVSTQLYPELLNQDTKLIIPNMVLKHTPIWVQIMFFGALISALLSTTSGAILAPAVILGENLIKPHFKNLTDKQLLKTIRFSVVVVTLVSILMALWRQDIFELVSESSAFSLVSLFVPLTFGLYWKRANLVGCLASMSLGLGVWLWCEFVQPTTFPAILYGLGASLIGMLAGTMFSQNTADLSSPNKATSHP